MAAAITMATCRGIRAGSMACLTRRCQTLSPSQYCYCYYCSVTPTTAVFFSHLHSSSSSSSSYSSPSASSTRSSRRPLRKRQQQQQEQQQEQLHAHSPATTPSTGQLTTAEQKLNPPASTRPAPLSIPAKLPASSAPSISAKFQRMVSLGKAYLTFYKTGVKNVYHNYRASIPLRRRLGLPVYLPTSLDCTTTTQQVDTGMITRAEFQLVERAAHDMRRLIPFCVLLVICGEMTPLVVLVFGNTITPATCRVPAQIAKHRAQRSQRKHDAMMAYRASTIGAVTVPRPGSDEEMELLADRFANPRWNGIANVRDLLCGCSVLDLVQSHHEYHRLFAWVLRRELRRFSSYLMVDDALILRDGGVAAMHADEVRLAVVQRGAGDMTLGKEVGWEAEFEERRWLDRWIQRRQLQQQGV